MHSSVLFFLLTLLGADEWLTRGISRCSVWLGLCIILAPFGVGQAAEPVIAPSEPIRLFNGRDLAGWSSWLVDTRRADPRQVFRVQDGLLRISGDGLGYLGTRQAYRDYLLVVEFRWGERNWGQRVGKARDAGIFLHAAGPDGNSFDADGAFRAALECQVMEGAVGDLMLIRGHDGQGHVLPRVASTRATERDDEGWPYFDPAGTRVTLHDWGRINWMRKSRRWQDEFGFRGPHDADSPPGEWTRIECLCQGDRVSVRVNGVLVNEAFAVTPASGPILLQCEGSEIFFRRVELLPLP